MNSQQSSFRDMFEHPNHKPQEPLKPVAKYHRRRLKKQPTSDLIQQKETFAKFVIKAKNVVLFGQKLKQRLAQKHTLNMHTLREHELNYLENESEACLEQAYFSNDSKLVMVLDFLFALTLLVFLWKNTTQIVFTVLPDTAQIVNISTLALYLLHIVLFLLTAYKDEKQELITDRQLIRSIYVRDKLLKDVVVVAMIVIQLTQLDHLWGDGILLRFVRIISLVAVIKFKEMFNNVENGLSVSTNSESTVAMFKLLFKIFLFLHCLTLLLNLFAELEKHYGLEQTWLQADLDSNNLVRYVMGWYFGATILSTVGFGDIVPVNHYERFLISIVQVFCCMAFGYFVNVIGGLLRMRAEREEKHEREMRSVNRCLNSLILTHQIKRKIQTHFLNKHMIEKLYDRDQQNAVMDKLTDPLKLTLKEENNIQVLKKSAHLQILKNETLLKIAHSLKRVIFAPEQILYSRGTIEKKLWLVESGCVQEYTDNFRDCALRKKICHYDEVESTVGWINFVTQQPYSSLAKAHKFTVVYELEEAKFRTTLLEDTRQYRAMLGLKQLMIERGRKYVQRCLSCDRYTHNVIDCPRIHIMRKDPKTITKKLQNLELFVQNQRKTRKLDRREYTLNWKGNFGKEKGIQMADEKLVCYDDSKLNTTIEHFVRQLTRKQSFGLSQKRFSSQRLTVNSQKGETKFDTYDVKEKESCKEGSQRSMISIEEQQEDSNREIDCILFDKQNKDYLPQHNIEQVLRCYQKLCSKTSEPKLKLFPFKKQ